MEHDEDNKPSMLASRGFWVGAAASVLLWVILVVVVVRLFS